MNTGRTLLVTALTAAMATAVVACGSASGTGSNSAQGWVSGSVDASYVRFSLVDKPSDDATSVMVNIQQVEVFASKGDSDHRIILGSNIGMVDLLKLQNGVMKGLGDLLLPEGVTIYQMRFVLGDGSYLVHKDGSTCALQTPSAQQSGVKLLFVPALTTGANMMYDFTLDFDVDSSIVFQGNGGCLLKPVIKVKAATETPIAPPPTPTPMPSPVDNGGSDTGASPSPTPSDSTAPSPTPSSGAWDPQPTGTTTTLSTTGSSDGTFSSTTSSTDPTVTNTGSFWQ